jgi:hypothetical protein
MHLQEALRGAASTFVCPFVPLLLCSFFFFFHFSFVLIFYCHDHLPTPMPPSLPVPLFVPPLPSLLFAMELPGVCVVSRFWQSPIGFGPLCSLPFSQRHCSAHAVHTPRRTAHRCATLIEHAALEYTRLRHPVERAPRHPHHCSLGRSTPAAARPSSPPPCRPSPPPLRSRHASWSVDSGMSVHAAADHVDQRTASTR